MIPHKDRRVLPEGTPKHVQRVVVILPQNFRVAIERLIQNPKSGYDVIYSILDYGIRQIGQDVEGSLDSIPRPSNAGAGADVSTAVVESVLRTGCPVEVCPNGQTQFPAPVGYTHEILPSTGNIGFSLDDAESLDATNPISHGNSKVRDTILLEGFEVLVRYKGLPMPFHVPRSGFNTTRGRPQHQTQCVFVDGIRLSVFDPEFAAGQSWVQTVVVRLLLGDPQHRFADLGITDFIVAIIKPHLPGVDAERPLHVA
mmetsp:Transcript_14055/g.32703  ORF Transcript_14055/g.32703 Transcript_14055/m.32703 type:complete len:256 (-) Transcript_14055:242-1009(-)